MTGCRTPWIVRRSPVHDKKLRLASQLRLSSRAVASSACCRLALSVPPILIGLRDSPSQVQSRARRLTPHPHISYHPLAPSFHGPSLRSPSYLY